MIAPVRVEGTVEHARSRPASGDPGLNPVPKKHFKREQEQDDSACYFERVHPNPNGVENNLPSTLRQDDSGVEHSAQGGAVPFRRVSAAVNPAKIATFPIGSIVVQIVAKSLQILISSGDIRPVCGNHL